MKPRRIELRLLELILIHPAGKNKPVNVALQQGAMGNLQEVAGHYHQRCTRG
jgi:hypothetical protein